jgi:hypothetical protein
MHRKNIVELSTLHVFKVALDRKRAQSNRSGSLNDFYTDVFR